MAVANSEQLPIPPRAMLPKWIKGNLFIMITGYTKDAIACKRKNGVWLEGTHWMKAPDGNIMYNPSAIDNWVENGS